MGGEKTILVNSAPPCAQSKRDARSVFLGEAAIVSYCTTARMAYLPFEYFRYIATSVEKSTVHNHANLILPLCTERQGYRWVISMIEGCTTCQKAQEIKATVEHRIEKQHSQCIQEAKLSVN